SHLARRRERTRTRRWRPGPMSAVTVNLKQGSPARWLISDTLVFARRNLEHIRQLPEKLIEVTIQPLMFVVLFAYAFAAPIALPGGNYREYLIGGILVQSLAFGLMGPAQQIATDL